MKTVAILIKNPRQFDALMLHYDNKGFKHNFGIKPVYGQLLAVEYKDKYKLISRVDEADEKVYHFIPFEAFAELTGVDKCDTVIIQVNPVTATVKSSSVHFDKSIEFMSDLFLTECYSAMMSLK